MTKWKPCWPNISFPMTRKGWWIIVIISLWGAGSMASQFPVSVDAVYDFIKNNSIHRNKVDWKKIDPQFSLAVSSAKTLADTMDAFIQVLKALDDVHSQLYLNNQYYGYWHPADAAMENRYSILLAKARETNNSVFGKILDRQFAYIRVPGFNAYGPEEINRLAGTLRDTLEHLGQWPVKGFIIDLRLNTGGNLYPMMSGLGPLLGDGEVAYEVDLGDTIVRTWKLANGNFQINDFPLTNLDSTRLDKPEDSPVVILIGPVTASSGSAVAITFKGRRNTCLIGEPTAKGYTTSNGYFQFAPNLYLNFAVAFIADRKLTLYPTEVDPDIKVEGGDDFENLLKDQKIKRALQWLKGNMH
jgi:carboxyl-terminal processing protease